MPPVESVLSQHCSAPRPQTVAAASDIIRSSDLIEVEKLISDCRAAGFCETLLYAKDKQQVDSLEGPRAIISPGEITVRKLKNMSKNSPLNNSFPLLPARGKRHGRKRGAQWHHVT